MVRRVRSDDLELMATAISIQHQVGGNLAEILDSIAYTIRERVRIKGEIRTLTAQQRLSGYVVGFLPIGLAGFLFVAAPGFMEPMFPNPPAVARPAGRRGHPDLRRLHDVHRLHVHPQDRGHRGLAHGHPPHHRRRRRRRRHPPDRPRPGRQRAGRPRPGPPDPARDDAGQEPRGARAPAAVLRADAAAARGRPLGPHVADHLDARSRSGPRSAWPWPATPATCASPTGSASRPSARSSAAILFFFLFVIVGVLGFPFPIGSLIGRRRRAARLHRPRVLAGPPRQEAPEGHHPA